MMNKKFHNQSGIRGTCGLLIACLFFIAPATFPTLTQSVYAAQGSFEVLNKSPVQLEEISPLVVDGNGNNSKKGEQPDSLKYVTGYNFALKNKGPKKITIKLELIFGTHENEEVVSYISYEVLKKGEKKTIKMICDDTPVTCIRKSESKESMDECKQYALDWWNNQSKRLIITAL